MAKKKTREINLVEMFKKVGRKLDKNPIPQKDRMFYWKGKWWKLNKENLEKFLQAHGIVIL